MSDFYLWLVHNDNPDGDGKDRRFKLALGVNRLYVGTSEQMTPDVFVRQLNDFLDEGGYPSDGDYRLVFEKD